MRAPMRLTVGLALSVALAACGGFSASSPSPSSSAGVPTCSLPVVSWLKNSGTAASQNGFVAVPSGAYALDPSSNGYTFDRAFTRWLPVLPSLMLPDGSMYAYEDQPPNAEYDIHVVQVASGADKVISRMPYDNAYSILALQPEGIYVVPILHRSGVPGGLWLLSSTAATFTAVPGAGDFTWQLIQGGAAWGGTPGGDRLDRLDLSTGVVTTWFRHDIAPAQGIGSSYGPAVVGFDLSGRPLIEFYPPVDPTATPAPTPLPEIWLVTGPSQATKLTGIALPGWYLRPGVTAPHGTWFAGSDGFYLYTDAGFRRAAPMPPGPVGEFQVAGDCA